MMVDAFNLARVLVRAPRRSGWRSKAGRMFLLCGWLLALAGCGPTSVATVAPVDSNELMAVPDGSTAGQSFVARDAGLQAIDLFLSTAGVEGQVELTLRLRASGLPGEPDLRTARITLPVPAAAGWYHFDFAPLMDSRDRSYYVFVESPGAGGVSLSTGWAASAAYGDGSLYLNHQPADRQLAFRLSYDRASVIYDRLAWAVQALITTAVMALLFIVPGLALQTYLLPLPAGSWKERLGLAAGLSLSLYPLILLWAWVIGVPPGGRTVWLPVGFALVALGGSLIRRQWQTGSPAGPVIEPPLRPALPDVVWGAALTIVLLVRLWLLRNADAPMWGDSVQHAVIGQLLVDHGGLFDSWLPYAPYQTLTVHYGFHSIVAALTWFTGEPVLPATLLAGQIINVLAILTLAPLATRLIASKWAALGAVVVAGLLSPLPNDYINWGRYAQLLGQAILPVAIWFVWNLVEEPGRSWQRALLASLVWAGALLAYYRMPHYVALFLAATVAFATLRLLRRGQKRRWSDIARPTAALVGSGVLALLLLLPWLLHLRSSELAQVIEASVTQTSALTAVQREYAIFSQAGSFLSVSQLLLAVVGLVWACARRQQPVLLIAVWTLGLLLLPAARLLPIPGANTFGGFSVLISLYIPIALLAGYAVDAALGWIAGKGKRFLLPALALLGIAVAPATWERLRAVDPAYRILAPADIEAMQWIRANTPRDSLFLVDGFLIYGGTSVVGSDGGWWIPLLTQREATIPPQYAILNERPIDPNYNQRIIDLVAELQKVGVASPRGIELVCRNRITHLYTGQGQGQIAIPPPEPLLRLAALESSPDFIPIYRQDKVGIFAVDEAACE